MEKDKLELKDNQSILILQDIKKDLQNLYDHYRSVCSQNDYLREENARLKSEAYKDEELAKMKEKYNKMSDDYYRGFAISEKQQKKINEWMDKIIGDGPDMKINSARFHYEFYPTPLGVSGKVVDGLTNQYYEFQEIG